MIEETSSLARIERLEAIHEIGLVMARYADLVDHGGDPDDIAALFTPDAVWQARGNLAEFGTTTGRQAIRDMFAGLPASLPFTAHYLTNPAIDADPAAGSGRGRWHTLEFASTTAGDGEQVTMVAMYDNDFQRVDGRWLLSFVRFEDAAVFRYTDGWLHTRYLSPVTLERIPR